MKFNQFQIIPFEDYFTTWTLPFKGFFLRDSRYIVMERENQSGSREGVWFCKIQLPVFPFSQRPPVAPPSSESGTFLQHQNTKMNSFKLTSEVQSEIITVMLNLEMKNSQKKSFQS